MKAAINTEYKGKLAITDLPIPEVGPNDVLVKIAACGVCHTDLHACHGDWPVKPKMPLVPGHEGVGVIEKLSQCDRGLPFKTQSHCKRLYASSLQGSLKI